MAKIGKKYIFLKIKKIPLFLLIEAIYLVAGAGCANWAFSNRVKKRKKEKEEIHMIKTHTLRFNIIYNKKKLIKFIHLTHIY